MLVGRNQGEKTKWGGQAAITITKETDGRGLKTGKGKKNQSIKSRRKQAAWGKKVLLRLRN